MTWGETQLRYSTGRATRVVVGAGVVDVVATGTAIVGSEDPWAHAPRTMTKAKRGRRMRAIIGVGGGYRRVRASASDSSISGR